MGNRVRSVCFRRDVAIKTVIVFVCKNSLDKCMTRWSILISNIFSCWLVLLFHMQILLALLCCKNPGNVNCFGTIFTNHKFAFVSLCAVRPAPMQSDESRSCPTVKWSTVAGWVPLSWYRWGATKKQRRDYEFAKWHIFTLEKCADKGMQIGADFKWLWHEWFHHVRHHVHDGLSVTIVWRLDSFTVSFSGDARGESGLTELASVKRRTRFRSRHLVRKCRDLKFWCVNLVVP